MVMLIGAKGHLPGCPSTQGLPNINSFSLSSVYVDIMIMSWFGRGELTQIAHFCKIAARRAKKDD